MTTWDEMGEVFIVPIQGYTFPERREGKAKAISADSICVVAGLQFLNWYSEGNPNPAGGSGTQ